MVPKVVLQHVSFLLRFERCFSPVLAESNREIKEFAQSYGAHFPMFAKTTVNPALCQGTADACEAESEACCPTNNIVYTLLKGFFDGPIQWNFEKVRPVDPGAA